MKRVFFFLPPTTGGAEKITTTIARMLNKQCFEVVFVIVGRHRGDVVNYIPAGSRIIYIPALSMRDFVWQKFWFLMKWEKPDYVFSSITPINCHAIHAAKRVGGVKTIVRCNCSVDRIKGNDKKMVEKYYPLADIVIAQTRTMRDELLATFNLSPNRVLSLNNPIDKDYLLTKSQEKNPYTSDAHKKYVWVGRFNEIKRVDVLVEAFAKVHDIDTTSRLYLVGKRDESNYCYKGIVALIEKLGVSDAVSFTDFQSNPYKWIKNADCLVLTSRSEASPNVVFESLFLGTPVVVSDCTPDLGHAITEGNGYVVKVGDVEQTAEAMVKAIKLEGAKLTREAASVDKVNRLFSF